LHYHLTDLYRLQPSFLHRLDPRVKLLAAFGYILVVSLTPEGTWWAFAFFFLLLLLATFLTRLGIFFTIRRSFIVLPFVLAALAVPFTSPGQVIWRIPGLNWGVSEPGLIRFLSILARSWLAVQAAILLTAVTQFQDLLWALGSLRFPRVLVSTIGFMYRYLFVLADEATRMMRARASRSARVPGSRRRSLLWQGRTAGAMVGSLFLRAIERSERVYAAMLSRGYDGQMRSLTHFHMRAKDWISLVTVGLLLIVPLSVDWMV
jgi:cobalt/nickel transport system permease protein